MKHLKSLFLVLPLLVCSGCNNELSTTSTSPEPVPPAPAAASFDVNYTLTPSLRKKETTKTGGYDLTFTFKDEYFKGNPTSFMADTEVLRQFANAQLLIVVALATSSAELGDNLKRVIDMHFPETNYVLLRSFEKTN